MRSKIQVVCVECGRIFFRWGGQVKARYCSRTCACRARNTFQHQQKAGKAGGGVKIKLRGTGTKTYIKEFGRHQHRVVMEKILGRKLTFQEVVHHKDGNKHNNNPENLQIVSRAEHIRTHCHGK